MKKVNLRELSEINWTSPKGHFSGAGIQVSEALGRDPASTDLRSRHPFDVEILRVPPGKIPYPYHSHSAQWEFYQVLSGSGQVRDSGGVTPIQEGDAFIFPPDEPHQIINNSAADLTLCVIADNPIGESCHYPDSNKWLVRSPERKILSGQAGHYYDGEE